MRKVLVIGSGGAGKSTLSNQLGESLKIEVLHLDKFYWRPGWIETPKSEWVKTVEELLTRDAWIMDGNYLGTFDIRFETCDTVIFLDMPRTLCIWRALKRLLMYRNKRRPDMGAGCPEKFNLEFILWIWNYPLSTRPEIVKMLKSNPEGKNIIWLRSPSEANRFLATQGTPDNSSNPTPR
jgi:adenylate kinase family enzyme